MKLQGMVAVITGAARGIGKAIAYKYAEEGASVILIDQSSPDDVAAEMKSKGYDAQSFALDITDHAAVDAAVEKIIREKSKIDILVNNAGIIARGTITELSHETWGKVINVNVNGTFNWCKAVVPWMMQRKSGKILNVTSIAGKMGDITAAPVYGTSKGAVNTLTKSLARQLAEFNINVNAVAPHAIETDMSAEWSDAKRKAVVESIPLKRMGSAEEVAEAALFLVSKEAAFITGEVLNVNGGFLMD